MDEDISGISSMLRRDEKRVGNPDGKETTWKTYAQMEKY
jgi:hypothetical protein